MPVPRRRHCPTRKRKRRANIKLHARNTVACESCGQPKIRHRVCSSCGTYKKVSYKATV